MCDNPRYFDPHEQPVELAHLNESTPDGKHVEVPRRCALLDYAFVCGELISRPVAGTFHTFRKCP